jgi:hypothetical protein
MASKTHGEAERHGDRVAEALEGLYGAPFDEFVARRKELATALRTAGDVAGSRLVAAATKPSRTAWALNQVARRRPELLRTTFEARVRAASAQTGGEDVRATARAFRERLAEVVQAAGDAAREDGSELTVAQGRRIAATVQAAAAGDEGDVRERLMAGRLVADVDVDDPFAGLEIGPARERTGKRDEAEAGKAHAKSREPERAPARPRNHEPEARARELEKARERELEKARERERERHEREREKARAKVAELEDEAREARVAAREAEVAAARARTEAERLRRAVEAVEKKLSDAKGELRSLGT